MTQHVEELNDLIASMHYRMQHESISLDEEKQMLQEIKQLEGTRDKVITNAAMKAKIQDSLGQKEAIQDQVKLISGDLDGVRREQQAVRTKVKHLEEELKAIASDIASLQEELAALIQKKDKAFETLVELRKQRDEGNTYFYQHRSLLNNARDLAAKKDVTESAGRDKFLKFSKVELQRSRLTNGNLKSEMKLNLPNEVKPLLAGLNRLSSTPLT